MPVMDIFLMILIPILWYVGGGRASWARDMIIPILVGVGVFVHHPIGLHWLGFLLSVLTIASCQIIRLGYGNDDPTDDKPSLLARATGDQNGWWIRGLWGAIVGIVSCVPNFALHHDMLTLLKCLAFTINLAVVGFTVVRLRCNRLTTDLFIGAAFALRIFI